jgi:hypothetical protein
MSGYWTDPGTLRRACWLTGLLVLAWLFAPVIKWYGEADPAGLISFARVVWMHVSHHIEPGYGMLLLRLPALAGTAGLFVPFSRPRTRLALPWIALGTGALHLIFIVLHSIDYHLLQGPSKFLRISGMVPTEWQPPYVLPVLGLSLVWLFLEWRARRASVD